MKVNNRKSLGGAAFLREPEDDAPPKPEKSKRYSTAFDLKATNSPETKEERKQQQIIAEMYQGVVKQVQENKLTAKNAFGSRNIIDNLDVVLKLANGSFHKASCAVATAAEVYCAEVDDLAATTSLVQEMLFNSDKKRGEMDGEDARQNRKKDGNSAVNLSACCTLETNLSNIRSDQVEAELEIDAQFQKLLQGKASGAQGMLLNILGVYNGPNLALDCTGVKAFYSDENANNRNNIGETDIPRDISARPPRIVNCRIAPALVSLREEIDKVSSSDSTKTAVQDSVVGSLDPRMSFRKSEVSESEASNRSGLSSPGSAGQQSSLSNGGGNVGPTEDYEFDDYMDADGGEYYDDDSGMMPEPAQATSNSFVGSTSDAGDANPSALPFIMQAFEAQAMGAESGKSVEFFEAPDVHEALELEANKRGLKFWVGDKHWKAPKARLVADESKRLVKKKKNERSIDFFAKPIDEKALLAKPTTQRLNQLPKSSLNSSMHLLPKNTGFSVSDFKRLFLRPNMVLQMAKAVSVADGPFYDYDDGPVLGGGDYGDDDDDGDFEDENDFYDCASRGSSPSKNLVAPAHHVERIRVAYATKAKKVDVKKLKYDLWETIDTLVEHHKAEEPSSEEPSESDTTLVESIKSLAPKEQNDAITVPFYFICMLHLANEHGLELQSSASLDDVMIVKS